MKIGGGGGVSASFQYDAMGRRANKTIAGASTGFLHDRFNPVQKQLGGGVNADLLAGGLDEFFSRTDQLGTHTLLTDGLGSTLALSDGSGSILTQYTYEPYGNTSVSGSLYNPFQFTGRENNGTGLYYYRARYYSPIFQRFVSEDPLQFASDTVNFYEYVYDDPVNYVDPFGLQSADLASFYENRNDKLPPMQPFRAHQYPFNPFRSHRHSF